MNERLTPKERLSLQLAEVFKVLLLRTGKQLETLAGFIQVNVSELRWIENGQAHKLPRLVLLKVFEFFPLDDLELKRQIEVLITSVSKQEKVRFHFSQR